jgi:hypothetical protein
MKFRLRRIIEASRWWSNGDHPLDYQHARQGFDEQGDLIHFSAEHCKDNQWEGEVVRFHRKPTIEGSGSVRCASCEHTLDSHGWIDGVNGQIVCPGEWVVTKDVGYWLISDDAFCEQYIEAGDDD